MARFGLILYLTLTTAAGPWLCCCLVAPVNALNQNAAPAERSESESSCCCCQDTPGDDALPADQAPTPARHCPCHQNPPETVALPAQDSASITQQVRLLVLLDSARPETLSHTPVLLILDADRQVSEESAASLSESPRDMLRALHILLC